MNGTTNIIDPIPGPSPAADGGVRRGASMGLSLPLVAKFSAGLNEIKTQNP
jgi:hypothetical protein